MPVPGVAVHFGWMALLTESFSSFLFVVIWIVSGLRLLISLCLTAFSISICIDIGGTLIGMHLRRVAVPVRLSLSKIGEANILCARTRPKLIGGERAKYTEED